MFVCMSWFMWRTWHIPIIHHYEKLCPPKPHYPTTRAKKNSYTTIVQLSSFQALQIIFEMRSQGVSQKKVVNKIFFYKLQNVFFSFFSFWPLLLSNLITFLFLIHFEWFKLLQGRHLKFYKSSLKCKVKGPARKKM